MATARRCWVWPSLTRSRCDGLGLDRERARAVDVLRIARCLVPCASPCGPGIQWERSRDGASLTGRARVRDARVRIREQDAMAQAPAPSLWLPWRSAHLGCARAASAKVRRISRQGRASLGRATRDRAERAVATRSGSIGPRIPPCACTDHALLVRAACSED